MKLVKIPLSIIDELKENGAIVEKLEGEDLYIVSGIIFKDKAWTAYEKWAFNKVPRIGANFGPSFNITDALIPSDDLIGAIQREIRSIVHHCSRLENGNHSNIGPPLSAPPIFSFVHHELSSLMNCIQNPPDNYPVLRSLNSGSYICTIDHVWSNASIEIVLFK